jgi:alpha-N-acetylglucosaminidase
MKGPEEARNFPNSTMVGIGITMEGINQNEFVYEFMLEKAWRSTLTDDEVNTFARDFALRRYFNSNVSFSSAKFEKAWTLIVVYGHFNLNLHI